MWGSVHLHISNPVGQDLYHENKTERADLQPRLEMAEIVYFKKHIRSS